MGGQSLEEAGAVDESAAETSSEADILWEEPAESKEAAGENEEGTAGAAEEPGDEVLTEKELESKNISEETSADTGTESENTADEPEVELGEIVVEGMIEVAEYGANANTDESGDTTSTNDGSFFENAKALEENSTVTISESNEKFYFSFTPHKAGMYSFYSTGTYDTRATLYSADKEELISNEDGNRMGDSENFRINYPLTSGETYILEVSAPYNTNVTFSVAVEQYEILDFASEGTVSNPGSVGFYKITPAETKYYNFSSTAYGCDTFLFVDGYGMTFIYSSILLAAGDTYYIEIQNNSEDKSTVTYSTMDWILNNPYINEYEIVEPGGNILLEPDISYVNGNSSVSLTYKWQVFDPGTLEYVDIPGTTSMTYTTTQGGTYICFVSDNAGNTDSYWAVVTVDTGFTASRTTPEELSSPVGTTATFGVSASSNYGPVSYQWYSNYSIGGINYSGAISGGTSPTLTITVPNTNYMEIYCVVRDRYNWSFENLWFYITPADCSHQWTTVIDKAPTCASAGSQHQECKVCHTKQSSTSIPATGNHSYGAYVQTTAPTALATGVNTRTCTVCGAKNTASIPKLTPTISVNATKLTLKVKQSTTKLTVSGLAAGDYVTSWKSSNTKIVTVNSKGKITAKNKTGKATVTVTLASGLTKKISVTVQKNTVTTTKITGLSKKISVAKGKKYTLKPVLTPITSTDKVTYKTSNKKVATVSAKGVIAAKAAGTAKITVTSGKIKTTVTVTVPKTKTTAITGVKSALTIKKGKTYKLKTKLTPKNSDQSVTYSTSNKKVATVDKNGKITAKKAGKATITVKSGSIKVKCVVTVK